MAKTRWMLIVPLVTFLGCGDSTPDQAAPSETTAVQNQAEIEPLSQPDLVDSLERNGIGFEWMEKSLLTPEQFNKLGAEPINHSSVRFKKDKESTVVTLVEFETPQQAQNVKNVNGFALRNWYFVGTISKYWVDEIKYAAE